MSQNSKPWFLGIDNRPVGPLSRDEVAARVRIGELSGATLVWRDGMAGWSPLRETELAAVLDPEPKVLRLVQSEPLPPSAPITVGAKAASVWPEGWTYGGFWLRAVALAIDLVIASTISTALLVFAALNLSLYHATDPEAFSFVLRKLHLVSPLLTFGVELLYFGVVQGLRGATPGKWVCGLRVVRPDGTAPGFWRGVFRYFGSLFSLVALGSGYAIAALHPRKRSWHDIVCGTAVVRTRLPNAFQLEGVSPEAAASGFFSADAA